jgi:predicted ATP-grasp superfamily ATP-dependent carboligase
MLHVDEPALDGLTAPVLVVAFEGWASAGSAGTVAADHLAREAVTAATFDTDALYDYRVSRPAAEFLDGVLTAVEWPSLSVRRLAGDPDLLVLSGPEPNWNWKRFSAEVAGFAERIGVTMQISLGGIPWAAPHTRPVTITTTASRPDLLGEEPNAAEGPLSVPAAAAIAVEHAVSERGIDTVGLWARVPHYVGGAYYPAALALAERVAARTGAAVDLESLAAEAAEQQRRLDESVAGQPQVEALVGRYEELYDAQGSIPSGEEIAAEFERFLRGQSDDDGGLA